MSRLAREHHQVRRVIVSLVLVNVMNNLTGTKRPAKHSLGDDANARAVHSAFDTSHPRQNLAGRHPNTLTEQNRVPPAAVHAPLEGPATHFADRIKSPWARRLRMRLGLPERPTRLRAEPLMFRRICLELDSTPFTDTGHAITGSRSRLGWVLSKIESTNRRSSGCWQIGSNRQLRHT